MGVRDNYAVASNLNSAIIVRSLVMYDQHTAPHTTDAVERTVEDVATRLSIRAATVVSQCFAILGIPEPEPEVASQTSITSALYMAESSLDYAVELLETIRRRLGCAL